MAEITELKGLVTKLLPVKLLENNNGQIEGVPKNPRFIKDWRYKLLLRSLTESPEMLSLKELWVYKVGNIYVVIAGNMRLRGSKEKGYKSLPCKILPPETSVEKLKEYAIKDNSGYGDWEMDSLANEWESPKIVEWGVELHGWENGEVPFEESETAEAKEDDFDTTPPAVAKTVLGDLYEIGLHRVLCGDSCDSDAVAKLMDGEKADVGFNDPPYGMKKESEGVIGDNMNFDDLLQFNRQWIALQFTHLKDNGSFYCWGTDEPLMDIYSGIIKPYIKTQKATFRNLITWDKGHGQGQNSDNTRSYAIADEKCLFVMCGVQGFNNNADNYFEGWETVRDYLLKSRLEMGWDIPTMKKIVGHSDLSRDHWTSKSQFNFPTKEVYEKMKAEADRKRAEIKNDAFKKEYDELKKEYYQTRAYFDNTHDNFNNVWHFDRHARNEATGGHATPKPIPLCERAIKSSCPDGGLVTDWFIGSGTTMVAAHQLNRKCYGMELSEKYCDVIVKRMLNLDSTLRVKRNGVDVTEEWRD